MVDKKNAGKDSVQMDEKVSALSTWPAMLLTIGMIAAAIYSFSPRSYDAFPETVVKADGFLANSVANRGSRYVAVGERGEILYADSPEGPWTDAEVDNKRGATLTRIRFISDDVAIALGHNGWIIRSEDSGKTWKEVQFNDDSSDPLLDFGGPYNGKLIAVGSFGQFETSQDQGKTWQKETLAFAEQDAADADADTPAEVSSVNDPESDDYDPFAAFSEGGGAKSLANEHLNGIAQTQDGALFIVGERGLLLRSTDNGETWNRLDDIYDGSFYGGVVTPDKGFLVYGMRGNAYVTQDQGQTWTQSNIPVVQGLFEGTVTDGNIILVGASNTVLMSSDNGANFELVSASGSSGLVSIVPLAKGEWLTAGEGGVNTLQPDKNKKSASREGDKS